MGAAVASLEERIYMAEVIVKARLVTTAEDLLTFRSLEYLKVQDPGLSPCELKPTAAIPDGTTKTRFCSWTPFGFGG